MRAKKGISAVVTTVLFVLLAVAAVSIIWMALRPTIEKSSEKISTSCIELDLRIDSCTKVDANSRTVKVTAKSGSASDLKFIFYDANGNTLETKNTEEKLEQLETKTYGPYYVPNSYSVNVAGVITTEAGEEVVCGLALANPVDCV